VPWCDACDRFLSPSTVKVDGTCPSCGRVVDAGHAHGPSPDADADEKDLAEEELAKVPWHLWLLAAALAVYLGYRALQGIEWLLGTVVH
jgi:hypothetical protein